MTKSDLTEPEGLMCILSYNRLDKLDFSSTSLDNHYPGAFTGPLREVGLNPTRRHTLAYQQHEETLSVRNQCK